MRPTNGVDGADSLPTKSRVWPSKRREEMHKQAVENPEAFWASEARKLDWYKTWDRVLDWDPPYARWFVNFRRR